jgi:integrase
MARKVNRLSARQVETISDKGRYADGNGLWLQVTNQVTKSWLFRFTLNGKQRQMGLGPVHTVSLAEARSKALKCRQTILEGLDPIDERSRKRQAHLAETVSTKTFAWCAGEYIAAHEAGWKNAKHAAQWSATLETYAFPIIGELSVAAIDTNLVVQVLEPIWTSKTETASRVRGRVEAILGWAKTRGYRDGDNPAQWKGHLDSVLPARSKVQKVKHHSALPYKDISPFMSDLRDRDGVAARGLEFAILTATRSGETRDATWDEINFETNEWTIPGERMKNEKQHIVPLTETALNVLRQMEAVRVSDYVFPGQRHRRPLSNMAFLKLLERMGHQNLTGHGFRSTFRDWAAEMTGHPSEVAEMALAHTVSNAVEAAYRRGDLRDKRRRLLEDWAAYCTSEPLPTDVVPIRGAS